MSEPFFKKVPTPPKTFMKRDWIQSVQVRVEFWRGTLALTEVDGWVATLVGCGVFGLYCEEVFVVCDSAIVRWRFGWIV